MAGALLAGSYSDRLGRARTLLILFIISPLLLLLFLWNGEQFALPLLIALGLTSLAPGPVLLATVQDEFPDNRALANGIYLALSFMIRAGGIWAVGWLADQYGLSQAYTLAALATFMAIPAAYILHKREEQTAVA
ncbi:MAG TPA: MFS transporter [Anaerolineae bacterium]|nr:MFS transporter [Anaerolineae bacterium]